MNTSPIRNPLHRMFCDAILEHVDVSTTEVARANMAMKQTALEKVSHISSCELPSWATDSSLLDWLDSFNKSLR